MAEIPLIGMTPTVQDVGGAQVAAKLSVTPGHAIVQGQQIDAKISVQLNLLLILFKNLHLSFAD